METAEILPGVRVTSDRCLVLDDGPTVVLGDLHLGYEKALEEEGMYIPRINTESIREALNLIIYKYEPKRIVLLGDIKHDFKRTRYEGKEEVRKEKIKTLSERFGMSDVLNTQMREYSHGMRQKLMVISALIHDPPAWILDEPMTGLDPSAAFELKQMMREHAKEGNAVLFSTHVLEVAEQLCDRIIIINNGKVVSEGTLEYLKLTNPGMTLEEIFVKLTGKPENEA